MYPATSQKTEALEWQTSQSSHPGLLARLRTAKFLSPERGQRSNTHGKHPTLAVQWLVTIATSYLVLTLHEWNITEPFAAVLVSACLVVATVLQRSSTRLLDKHSTHIALLLIDTALIVTAITSANQIPWDLLLLFFACVLIAATGESLIQIALGCILVSFAFLAFVNGEALKLLAGEPVTLIRIPFLFGISIFYGYLANELKKEQKRNEHLQESIRLKRQIVAGIAHDIKTPLNVILGHAELLAGDSKTTGIASIACIRRNVDDISKLLSDFLLISKLEKGHCDSRKTAIQLNATAEEVLSEQSVFAREKNVQLFLDLDKDLKTLVGDPTDMHRAVSNLINNAIKFSPSAGSVTVSTRNGRRGVALHVHDTGLGIAREDLSSLFSEYKRLKSAETTTGTGLGLFIVKTIVESHGGNVEVESDVGVGTTFTIRIPTQGA